MILWKIFWRLFVKGKLLSIFGDIFIIYKDKYYNYDKDLIFKFLIVFWNKLNMFLKSKDF